MNFTFNNSSVVSVNSGTIVLNVSGKTRTFVDAKLVSIVDGRIVLDLPELSKIKGTYLVAQLKTRDTQRTFIAKSIEDIYITSYITQCQDGLRSTGSWTSNICRYATTEEIQELDDQLKAEGKCWNPDTMQIEKLRWKPNKNDIYYYISSVGWFITSDTWDNWIYDMEHYAMGNCFKTKEEAEAKLKQIKQILNSTI